MKRMLTALFFVFCLGGAVHEVKAGYEINFDLSNFTEDELIVKKIRLTTGKIENLSHKKDENIQSYENFIFKIVDFENKNIMDRDERIGYWNRTLPEERILSVMQDVELEIKNKGLLILRWSPMFYEPDKVDVFFVDEITNNSYSLTSMIENIPSDKKKDVFFKVNIFCFLKKQ